MNDKEENAFRLVYRFYDKWRSQTIETQEQWDEFSADVGTFAKEADMDHCPLACRLIYGAMEAINDLYKGGMKPVQVNYFGRDDL